MLRKAVMITATLTLGLGAVGIGVTPSGADSGTHCTFQHVPNLNPGLSYKPSDGTFTDPGGGTAKCEGAVSGSGSYTDSGTVSGTCQGGGVAEGDPTFTIGDQTFTDHVKITFGELTPTKGDCIINPVSQVKGVGEFMLK